MTPQSLIYMGFYLAKAFEEESRQYYFKDSHYENALMSSELIRTKTEELVRIMNHPGVAEEMESCPLLANAGP